jgi:hypothetical protein
METKTTLPETIVVMARGHVLEVDASALSPEIIAQAVEHGLRQTISDAASAAASGAYETQRDDGEPDWKALSDKERKAWTTDNGRAVADHGLILMQKRVDALMRGDWQTRTQSVPGMSDLEAMAVKVADESLTPAAWKERIPAWDELSPIQRKRAKLDVLQASESWEKVCKVAESRLAESITIKL